MFRGELMLIAARSKKTNTHNLEVPRQIESVILLQSLIVFVGLVFRRVLRSEVIVLEDLSRISNTCRVSVSVNKQRKTDRERERERKREREREREREKERERKKRKEEKKRENQYR